jgi:GntR family transcriptional regulator
MPLHPALDRAAAQPLYKQLAGYLLQRIDAGTLAPGQRLPSEPELMKTHGVARVTVRQAIALLVRGGKLVTQRGKGTFVTTAVVRHELDALQGFQESLRRQGIEPRTTLLDWSAHHGALDSELPPGLMLPVRLRRLYAVDDKPFAVVTGWLPPGAASLGRARAARLNVYEILSQFMGVQITHADVSIRSERAPREIAQLLGLPKSAMVLLMQRHSFDHDGHVCEFMRIHIVPERYEFRLRVHGGVELARAVHRTESPSNVQGAKPS